MKYSLLIFIVIVAITIKPFDLMSQTWSPLNLGVGSDVYAITQYQGEIYAAGEFTLVDTLPFIVNYIAKWDGNQWYPVGTGLNGPVYTLCVYQDKLIAGGFFSQAGVIQANCIASWDGTTWSSLADGFDGKVKSLCVYDSVLYAGGLFANSGLNSTSRIAKWNDSLWLPLGTGCNDNVNSLVNYDDYLYVAGAFTLAGGIGVSNIAKWNGISWSSVGLGANSQIKSLCLYDSLLILTGSFTVAGGISLNRIASWNGVSFGSLDVGIDQTGESLAASQNDLFVGGQFSMAGGLSANYVAKWNGVSWNNLGSGMNSIVYSLYFSPGSKLLYAGGDFSTAGGILANKIAYLSEDIYLPIELVDFNCAIYENKVQLYWTTMTEIENDYFAIERATNKMDFKQIGTVDGFGNSVLQHQYNFVDDSYVNDIVYYRLVQFDFDGDYNYSNIISIDLRKIASIKDYFGLYTDGIFTLSMHDFKNIDVFNSIGNKIYPKIKYNGNICWIDLTAYSDGLYFVEFGISKICLVKQ